MADFATFSTALTALGPTFELTDSPEEAQSALARLARERGIKTAIRWEDATLEGVGAVSALTGAGVSVMAPDALAQPVGACLGAVDMGLTSVAYGLSRHWQLDIGCWAWSGALHGLGPCAACRAFAEITTVARSPCAF